LNNNDHSTKQDLLDFVYTKDNDMKSKQDHKFNLKKLDKSIIEQKIKEKDIDFFDNVFEKVSENDILKVLENFGKLPKNFPSSLFENLLKKHDNEKIKFLAVKNLGKTQNPEIVNILKPVFKKEQNTILKREIVSSIGRLRNKENIPLLIEILNDKDPKIVMQAMRALFIFKDLTEVRNALEPLKNHKNEIIREITEIELSEHNASITRKELLKTNKKFFPLIKNTSVLGDVRNVLKLLPDECIHLTFTSPPYYNAKDYSIYPSYEDYLNFLVDVFKEVHRITQEGRFFILNTSPVLIPRFSRKYASHRFAIPFDIHPKIIDIGFEFIEDIIWQKPAPSAINRGGGFFQHRKPLGYKANLIVEYVMVYRKKTHRLIDWNMQQYPEDIIEKSKMREDYEKTNVWNIAPANNKVHPAVFPEELVYWIIKLYSYNSDIVLDPFAGSGTVGKVCQKTERNFFLTEIDETYFKYSKKNLSQKKIVEKNEPKFYNSKEFEVLIENIKNS